MFHRIALLSLLLLAGSLSAQTPAHVAGRLPSPLSLEVSPSVGIPLSATADAALFGTGGGGQVGFLYSLPGMPLQVGGGVQYSFAPVLDKVSSLSFASTGLKAGLQFPLAGPLGVFASGTGGWYFAARNDFKATATNPFVAGTAGLDFALDPALKLQAGVQYNYYVALVKGAVEPLYQGLGLHLGVSLAMGNLGGAVTVPSFNLLPAYPVFFKHYDDHPIGTVTLHNGLNVPVSGITTQVFIKEFMDAPKTFEVKGTLAPGADLPLDLYALFTDRVLNVTEGTKVATEITLRFSANGQQFTDASVQTMTVLGRNAMTWDDNRKAAAFVTAKDPEVLGFARSVTSSVRAQEKRLLNGNLVSAIALHTALDQLGVNYTRNPVTPYDQVYTNKTTVDFLQFPRETFQYRAGDCSDLSILYAALFQAVGIDSAFVTVPGHIFIAFDTKLTPAQADKELIPAGTFIEHGGTAWVPIEVTLRNQGFMKAWQLGAEEWAGGTRDRTAEFWPVQEAWKVYQPVGLTGTGNPVTLPPQDKILTAYVAETGKWLDQTISDQVAKLQNALDKNQPWTTNNKLGILYAKYGKSGDAEAQFQTALKAKPDYLPALQNLGNLYFVQSDLAKALVNYQKASLLDPVNAKLLLALSRTNQALSNDKVALLQYQQLQTLDPDLASQFPRVGDAASAGGREASMADDRLRVLWDTGD